MTGNHWPKGLTWAGIAALLAWMGAQATARGADFKGEVPPGEIQAGMLLGLSMINSSGGFSLLGTVARPIVEKGWADDVADQVLLELELGPAFFSGDSGLLFSTHLRWDFHKDADWAFFALGGLFGRAGLGGGWPLYPRFGVGALQKLQSNLWLRGEVSAELIVVGATFPF